MRPEPIFISYKQIRNALEWLFWITFAITGILLVCHLACTWQAEDQHDVDIYNRQVMAQQERALDIEQMKAEAALLEAKRKAHQ